MVLSSEKAKEGHKVGRVFRITALCLEKKSGDLLGNGGKDIKTTSTNASNWLPGTVASHLKVTRLSPVCCWGDSLGAFGLLQQPILNHSSWLTLLLSLSSPLHTSYIMYWNKMLASFWEERGISNQITNFSIACH